MSLGGGASSIVGRPGFGVVVMALRNVCYCFLFIFAGGTKIGCCILELEFLSHDGNYSMCHIENLDVVAHHHFLEDNSKIFPVNDVEEVLVPVFNLYEILSHIICVIGSLEGSTRASCDLYTTNDKLPSFTLE